MKMPQCCWFVACVWGGDVLLSQSADRAGEATLGTQHLPSHSYRSGVTRTEKSWTKTAKNRILDLLSGWLRSMSGREERGEVAPNQPPARQCGNPGCLGPANASDSPGETTA